MVLVSVPLIGHQPTFKKTITVRKSVHTHSNSNNNKKTGLIFHIMRVYVQVLARVVVNYLSPACEPSGFERLTF